MPHNIEKSGFHRGQYVGYGQGTVWRIVKERHGWVATPRDANLSRQSAATLSELSRKIEGSHARDKKRCSRDCAGIHTHALAGHAARAASRDTSRDPARYRVSYRGLDGREHHYDVRARSLKDAMSEAYMRHGHEQWESGTLKVRRLRSPGTSSDPHRSGVRVRRQHGYYAVVWTDAGGEHVRNYSTEAKAEHVAKKVRLALRTTSRDPKRTKKTYGGGVRVQYLPANQAYAVMWHHQILSIHNQSTEAHREARRLTEKAERDRGRRRAKKGGR